ncbi:HisA/HisF-related TIM barrel protein [Collinsella aerofaciens]|uniref:HisA/HisF-related TIM barrel protein n=1 Tax=Collinsella aerofaciens TaxID=74426 RepID=UPI003D31B2F6
MLTKRVIPCLDVKDGRVVKGVNFVSLRDAGDPVELARAYDREGADEVVFLDITATSDNRATTIEMAAHAAEELAIPYTVGGGFRDLAGMRTMVAAGADKVSLNSAAARDNGNRHRAGQGVAQLCRRARSVVDQPGRRGVWQPSRGRGDRCQARGAARGAGRR